MPPATEDALSSVTDADGRFAFDNVEPGNYTLSAFRDGFQFQNYGVGGLYGMGEPIKLAPGDQRRDIVMRLIRLGVLAGRVLDEAGDPVQYVRVQAMAYQYTASGRQLIARAAGDTNDLGEYRISGIVPGRYYVHAKPRAVQGFGPRAAAENEPLASAYYPGSPDAVAAIPIDVGAGQQVRDINITLHKGPVATVRGRVVKPEGATAIEMGVIIPGFEGNTIQGLGMQDPDGNFVIRGLPLGSYVLNARSKVGARTYSVRRLIRVSSADMEGIELRPLPPLDLTGQVRVEGGPGIKLSQMYVRLAATIADSNDQFPGRVREDGTFTLKNVAPDLYRVTFPNLADLYVKSIRWGGADIMDSALDLTGARADAELTVILGADGGQIEGTVESEEAGTAMLTLVPSVISSYRAPYLFRLGMTDLTGHFAIRGIAPGSYKLYAWDQVDQNGVLYDPDYLKPFEASGRTIEIQSSSKETVQLKLIRNTARQ
jgi:hypothetical protein